MQKILLLSLFFTATLWANESALSLSQQREYFLKLEDLLIESEKQKIFPQPLFALVDSFKENHYPLQEELAWLTLKVKLASKNAENLEEVAQWIEQFSAIYPNTAKNQRLDQYLFSYYYQKRQYDALLSYANKVSPSSDNQCYYWSAKFQLLTEQLKTAQVEQQMSLSKKVNQLFSDFAIFWVKADRLSSICADIEHSWQSQGGQTAEHIYSKVVWLIQKNAKESLMALSHPDTVLQEWIKQVQRLLSNPSELRTFLKKQAFNVYNKAIITTLFPRFIKTQSEKIASPDFSLYQQWAMDWQLTEAQYKVWKITFIRHFFDNPDPIFQLWRDEQLILLQDDDLTERRLRLAIRQQENLNPWINSLSVSARNKAEWRYWWAKTNPAHSIPVLEKLAKERGFYAILAAETLNQPYLFQPLTAKSLSNVQKNVLKLPLARVTELRALNRLTAAKTEWQLLLQQSDFAQKLALADYANQQQWFDLGVEATIQAKAWDYLSLRLPNAYADWFELLLKDSTVSNYFAMAIARQESAWNIQARSHANAIGLMQMLPRTAQETARKFGLPYRNEKDLLSPLHNLLLGTAHLRHLNEKYPNNRILIAAAYNTGSHRVQQWLARSKGTLTVDEFIATIPFYETRGYVQNVLAFDYYHRMLYQANNTPLLFIHQDEKRLY